MQYKYARGMCAHILAALYFNSQKQKKILPFTKALFCSGMLATMLKKHLQNYQFTTGFLQSLIVLDEVLSAEWALFTAAGFMMSKR